jgi:DNA-binding transcriptional LysR family regulator
MRNLSLDQLSAFVEVIESGSFTAAAKRLHLSQPAVTHQVHELERRFKVPLIERLGKRIHLTQAGKELLEHARRMLDADVNTSAAMRRFVDGWLGQVRIGTSMTVLMHFLPPILQEIKTRHPRLEILIKAGLSETTLEMLKSNALDLGLCAMPIGDPSFQVTPLFTDELVAILPDTIEHVPKRATPQFLARQPLVLGNPGSALRKTISDWLSAAGPPPTPVMEFDNVEAMKRVVGVGLGASVVPRSSVVGGHLPANTIVVPLNPKLSRENALVRRRDKRSTEGLDIVIAALLARKGTSFEGDVRRSSEGSASNA